MPDVDETSLFGTSVHVVVRRGLPDIVRRIREGLAAAGIQVTAIDEVSPSLEDVFLEMVRVAGEPAALPSGSRGA
jgi:hypothetical protein